MSLYEILQVPKAASHHEITASYKRLVFQHHPNLNSGDDRRFMEITRAFRILGDRKFRYHYDIFGEKALEYLSDNHASEFIVNLYDRINLVFFMISLGLLLTFLFSFPYLLISGLRVCYSAFFVLLYFSALLLLVPFFRTWQFLRTREQYKNEKRNLCYNSLKIFLFVSQVFSVVLFYDKGMKNAPAFLVPTVFLEGFFFCEAYFFNRNSAQRSLKGLLVSLFHFLVRTGLVYGLLTNTSVLFKCFAPFLYVFHFLILKQIPAIGAFFVSMPVLLLSVSAGCFISKSFYWLGLGSAFLFHFLLVLCLAVVLKVYKNTSKYVFSESSNPSLIIINN